MRALSGVVAYVFFCAEAFFGGLCYEFFGKQGWNLSPHCRAANSNWHQGDKTRSKNLKLRSFHFFGGFFFKKNLKQIGGVASSFSAGAAPPQGEE